MTGLSSADEFALYRSDRRRWAQYVVPRWRAMLQASSDDRKRELWQTASPDLRLALRELKLQEAS